MAYILYENYSPEIVIITLNRPDRLNAMGQQLRYEFEQALDRYNQDSQSKAAILTGAGRAFCAGIDVKERAEHYGSQSLQHLSRTQIFNEYGTADRIKPVIAAVRGYCLGAGLNIIMTPNCDIRIAGENALFGMPEVDIGLMCLTSPFASQYLHASLLSELLLVGDPFSAQKAYELGLISRVVPDEDVMSTAIKLAERIATKSPSAIRKTKMNMLKTFEPTSAALAWEKYLGQHPSTEHDAKEGALAFVEKRNPVWEGDKIIP